MPTECLVHGCKKAAIAKGLCDTHRKRRDRHGHVEDTRAGDWGSREKHPAYKAWCGLRRYHRFGMPPSWADDFWAFAGDVPAKPEVAQAQRPDKSRPWGPDNFFWKEPRTSAQFRADKATYMREWHREARAANADYQKDKDLRRNYGTSLAWYRAQEAEQEGLCAVCLQPETAVIKGRVMSLAVDHCHDTGRIRGLLCTACNTAIGLLQHDESRLHSAIVYLKEFKCIEPTSLEVSELPENPQS